MTGTAVNKSVFGAFCAYVLAYIMASTGAFAQQSGSWVQFESYSTLREAEASAQRYSGQFENVAGFRLTSGWYVLAIGPFPVEEDAVSARRNLQIQGQIPGDAFVMNGNDYGPQFWPFGAPPTPAAVAQVQSVASTTLNTPAQADTDKPDAAPADTAAVEPTPAPMPIIVELPEETRGEAIQSESRLSRDERAALQIALQWFGFYNQGIDASFGPGTRASMAAYQDNRGFEDTGVLTSRQREQLIREYSNQLAELGMETWRDESAGIEVQLPLGMIAFDGYDAPFVQFSSQGNSGVSALLISQSGSQATLFGLYEIMQTLEIVPLDGERRRQNNSFVLTGQNDTIRSHTFAQYANGQVKGFTLIWPPERDEQMARVLPFVQDSFSSFGGSLPDTAGQASAVQRRDLMAGLEIRRPERSVSGFYVDGNGTVVTSASAVATCRRVTIDEAYDAAIVSRDDALGVAILRPDAALAPMSFAQFLEGEPRLASEIAVSGFSYEDMLTRPVMTFGTFEDVSGLAGEDFLRRLAIEVLPGDAGGPVFGSNGAVMGMLLPRAEPQGRVLPEDVNFAVSSQNLRGFLSQNGVRVQTNLGLTPLSPEMLTRNAADMTVIVSCWN
jgi:S1-C subfamily serine protease